MENIRIVVKTEDPLDAADELWIKEAVEKALKELGKDGKVEVH